MELIIGSLEEVYPEHMITYIDTYDLLEVAEKQINNKIPMKIFTEPKVPKMLRIFIIDPEIRNDFDTEGYRFVIVFYSTRKGYYLTKCVKENEILSGNIREIISFENRKRRSTYDD